MKNVHMCYIGVTEGKMKKVNKQCLLDTPRTVRVSGYSSNMKTLVLIRRFQ